MRGTSSLNIWRLERLATPLPVWAMLLAKARPRLPSVLRSAMASDVVEVTLIAVARVVRDGLGQLLPTPADVWPRPSSLW